MRNLKTLVFIIILNLILYKQTFAQDTTTKDYFNNIKSFDLSILWTIDSISDDTKETIERAEPLGYIDTSYQRFYIHFTAVTKNTSNPIEYLVQGKTKVNNSICDFNGTIKILEATLGRNDDFPGYKQGYVICEVQLYENKNQKESGYIKGKMLSQFIIDDHGKFSYDALMFVADSYSNNQFEGSWTSYKTKKSKKCNWGDYRIPDSGDLDVGVGEFCVSDKYLKNGWQTYRNAYINNDNNARQEEDKEWWK